MSEGWEGPDGELGKKAVAAVESRLRAYAEHPADVREHANIERNNYEGGYGQRQAYELIQNGADALLEAGRVGRIELVVTDDTLYCANEGMPLDADGLDALLASHMSHKRGAHIGRFGLGFKSVLGVSSCPEVFSRSVSLHFDAAAAHDRIRDAVGEDLANTPVLRAPTVIDPADVASGDPVLARLMDWATTVVKLPLDRAAGEWLDSDVAEFPPEFLLFTPHVHPLVLRSERSGASRTLGAIRTQDGAIELHVEGEQTRWRVFETTHVPSPEAKEDAGEWAKRDTIPVSWAVPEDAKSGGRGRFWAFFPTQIVTGLRGIVNAPWHMNNDRQNLLDGPFNHELVDVVGRMVAEHVTTLYRPDDPGAHLDVLPGPDARIENPWHVLLMERVYEHADEAAIVPNQAGELVPASSLRITPSVAEEALALWAAAPSRPLDWTHPSTTTAQRQARIRKLAGTLPATVGDWLGALINKGTAEESSAAIVLADNLLEQKDLRFGDRMEVQSVRCVRTTSGSWTTLGDSSVMLLPPDTEPPADVELVDPEVAKDPRLREILQRHGHRTYEGNALVPLVLALSRGREVSWPKFWKGVGEMGVDSAVDALVEHQVEPEDVRLRTVGGLWQPIDAVLLPGDIVTRDHASVCVDTDFHHGHEALLEWLGVSEGAQPSFTTPTVNLPWYRQYLKECRRGYFDHLQGIKSRPQEDKLDFARRVPIAGPTAPLERLKGEALARLTESLVHAEGNLPRWRMGHMTRGNVYPSVAFPHPLAWLLRWNGAVRTSRGVVDVAEAWGPLMRHHADVLPVVEDRVVAAALDLQNSFDDLDGEGVKQAFDAALNAESTSALGAFYGDLAAAGVEAPEKIRCNLQGGDTLAPPSEVRLCERTEWAAELDRLGDPYLLVDHSAAKALSEWGCQATDRVREDVHPVQPHDPVCLSDLFPALQGRGGADVFWIVRCHTIRLNLVAEDQTTTSFPRMHSDGQTLWVESTVEEDEVLAEAVKVLGLRLHDGELRNLLLQRATDRQIELRSAVRVAPTLEERVVAAVGDDALRSSLPPVLVDRVAADDAETLGKIALAVHGVDVLRVFKDAMTEAGLAPPGQWVGGQVAREFVRELGFPEEYAGFRSDRLPDREVFQGRPVLEPLHDFQLPIHQATRAILDRQGAGRGLVSLPTGAGKTRIAVQAIVEHLAEVDRPQVILWVAQTEELCEQAVQTVRYVWRAYGPDQDLTVSRLWGGNHASAAGGHHIVVAGIQKLTSVIAGGRDYAWLQAADSVVIDEAHRSVPKSYTELLRWLGIAVGAHRTTSDAAVLLGLTATPFRGTNEAETSQLVARYDGNRLDRAAFPDSEAVYERLQAQDFLASVDHEVLRGGSIELSESEVSYFQRFGELPSTVEDRLGVDEGRNTEIVEAIMGLPDDWPVLAFAASVEHAQILAAMLRLRGVAAAPIWGETPKPARRHHIQRFREGELRVLTNYNVLAEGFDAPAVRAVVVGRPTFSPNRYQQMIGRGLRGPKNGGKDRCLVIDVEDNVERFGQELAFREFEFLWDR